MREHAGDERAETRAIFFGEHCQEPGHLAGDLFGDDADQLLAARRHAHPRGAPIRGALPLVPGVDGVGRLADGRRVYFVAASDTLGSMADQTLAEARHTVPLPDEVSSPAIAALMLPAISSWVALTRRVLLQAGQSVLVLGATGAAGQLAV